MGLFSFLKKKSKLKCDWCGREMENPAYAKFVGGKKYSFCSKFCKKNFRTYAGKSPVSCPTCPTCAALRS